MKDFLQLERPAWIGDGVGVHENPRFFKYYWQIWTRDNAIADNDLDEFGQRYGPYPWLALVPKLSFSDAIAQMSELCEREELFMVLNHAVKRGDPAAPWDITILRTRGDSIAPAYDDDIDVPFFGHK